MRGNKKDINGCPYLAGYVLAFNIEILFSFVPNMFVKHVTK